MPRKAGAIPLQALPPDKRPKEPPPPFEDMLPSGITVKWRMPDPFKLIAFDGLIPDPVTSAVLDLLREEQYKTAETDPRKFIATAQQIKGMYGLAGAMLVDPPFDPSLEYGEDGTLGRREIGVMDCAQLWWLFRLSTRHAPARVADPNDAERTTDDRSDSAALREAAE